MNSITYIQKGHSNSQRLAQNGLSCVVGLKCSMKKAFTWRRKTNHWNNAQWRWNLRISAWFMTTNVCWQWSRRCVEAGTSHQLPFNWESQQSTSIHQLQFLRRVLLGLTSSCSFSCPRRLASDSRWLQACLCFSAEGWSLSHLKLDVLYRLRHGHKNTQCLVSTCYPLA